MKKLQTLLYVTSIAAAVGIGAVQQGNESTLSDGSAPKCTQAINYPDCSVVKCGEHPVSESSQNGVARDCVANHVPNGWCLKAGDTDCSTSQPTLSCNTDCE
jgi:hypothetical protein